MRCAPPDNKPLPEEIRNCLPYLDRELALIRPRAVLALGGIALNAYLDLLKSKGADRIARRIPVLAWREFRPATRPSSTVRRLPSQPAKHADRTPDAGHVCPRPPANSKILECLKRQAAGSSLKPWTCRVSGLAFLMNMTLSAFSLRTLGFRANPNLLSARRETTKLSSSENVEIKISEKGRKPESNGFPVQQFLLTLREAWGKPTAAWPKKWIALCPTTPRFHLVRCPSSIAPRHRSQAEEQSLTATYATRIASLPIEPIGWPRFF